MKLNVTLPTDAVTYLDHYAFRNGPKTRSAVLVSAIQLLRQHELSLAYHEAWAEWTNEDENFWSSTSNDGSELVL